MVSKYMGNTQFPIPYLGWREGSHYRLAPRLCLGGGKANKKQAGADKIVGFLLGKPPDLRES